uniref:Uncharacterized protein n=1 Tax=Chromera velia CCMP2878 TaxID=1169474 RepID=A0A0G4HXS2_9ALVE|eukprot:Cvel_9333.t1-p1 / transcript=Cvel_9333.t1 / gene=Cvel_9333 / organism=Chromera_velia_CCMP2878 / gene_product=hypothetical protein / transcript_product=hypothetical protein / location=Cvel_scaffold535:56016-56618(+) / protein_length=201 / sequence_SO=supercontig / SO=protein_coding / is_pseudo=false
MFQRRNSGDELDNSLSRLTSLEIPSRSCVLPSLIVRTAREDDGDLDSEPSTNQIICTSCQYLLYSYFGWMGLESRRVRNRFSQLDRLDAKIRTHATRNLIALKALEIRQSASGGRLSSEERRTKHELLHELTKSKSDYFSAAELMEELAQQFPDALRKRGFSSEDFTASAAELRKIGDQLRAASLATGVTVAFGRISALFE